MCCGQENIQSLKLELPILTNEDLKLLEEYISNESHLSDRYIFDTFNKLYKTNYVFNPKQQSRARVNMDYIVGLYKRDKNSFNIKPTKVLLDNKYTYEYIDHIWTLIEQTTVLIKGMKKTYTDESFTNLLKTDLINDIMFL